MDSEERGGEGGDAPTPAPPTTTNPGGDDPTEVSGPDSLTDTMGVMGGDSGTDAMEKGALSPLTGSYLLIVLAEPHSEEDREVIIQRLIKGNSTHNNNPLVYLIFYYSKYNHFHHDSLFF
ncbi:Microtubule-associated protein futsch [Orchesella cincta]|uniref:Microtubule-associated protein futsch n=1 Tax=Orchesella cincta TaxID=48709 RepID=A0A1D2N2C0_ORCCI|nr:Microtubule-associated protein futsch [Orchesella cincta]